MSTLTRINKLFFYTEKIPYVKTRITWFFVQQNTRKREVKMSAGRTLKKGDLFRKNRAEVARSPSPKRKSTPNSGNKSLFELDSPSPVKKSRSSKTRRIEEEEDEEEETLPTATSCDGSSSIAVSKTLFPNQIRDEDESLSGIHSKCT